jgi:hypothetical protein
LEESEKEQIMSKQTIIRAVVFVAMCIPCLLGVWFAHALGRSALGPIGGVLVALVAALMLGGLIYIVAILLPQTPEKEPGRRV